MTDMGLENLIDAAYRAAGYGPEDQWERPMPDQLEREQADRRALIRLDRTHDDAWTIRWRATGLGRRRGNGDGTVIPAYSTRMAGERLAALLDALDWWLATGHADRLDEWA